MMRLPDHTGDWYFTGDYPTPGRYRVVHKAFLNFYEKKKAGVTERRFA